MRYVHRQPVHQKRGLPDELYAAGRHPLFKRFDPPAVRRTCARCDQRVPRHQRAHDRLFAEHYATDYPEPEAILAACLAGFTVREAPVVMRERQGGVSSISSLKSVYYMVKVSLALLIDRFPSSAHGRSKHDPTAAIFYDPGRGGAAADHLFVFKTRAHERQVQPAVAGAGRGAGGVVRCSPTLCMCCATCWTSRCR